MNNHSSGTPVGVSRRDTRLVLRDPLLRVSYERTTNEFGIPSAATSAAFSHWRLPALSRRKCIQLAKYLALPVT
jgi:hypothetical protein